MRRSRTGRRSGTFRFFALLASFVGHQLRSANCNSQVATLFAWVATLFFFCAGLRLYRKIGLFEIRHTPDSTTYSLGMEPACSLNRRLSSSLLSYEYDTFRWHFMCATIVQTFEKWVIAFTALISGIAKTELFVADQSIGQTQCPSIIFHSLRMQA